MTNTVHKEAPESALRLLGRVWREYLRRHWPWLIMATLLMMLEGSTLGLLSYSLEPMFDRVLVGREEHMIYVIGGAIMALFLIRAGAGVAHRVILTRVGQISVTDMQKDLLSHLMRMDSLYFHETAPGALIERVQGDTAQIQTVWQSLIQGAARDVIALFSLGLVAVLVDPMWALTALVGFPLLILPAIILQRYLRRKAGDIREASYARSTRLSEVFFGMDTVKLNRMEEYQNRRFAEIVDKLVTTMVKTAGSSALLPGLLDIVVGVGFFAVLVLGGQEILAGEKTVGEFMSFFTAMALAFQPMRRLANLAGVLQTTAASLERVFSVLDAVPTIISPAHPKSVPEHIELRFDDVEFTYGDEAVLRGLTFSAEEGKMTALVGPSGAGKSTVFRLLTRLIEPRSGTISMGGIPIQELNLGDLRDQYSVVTQDAPMFDESLRENIVLGAEGIDDARLATLLEDANLTEFVGGLEAGLETRAGPRGANLSGGQRQRVAIARAFLKDAPILLLDEATSALDAKSEKAIHAALARLSHGRTSLVIAHRLSTIQNAEKILVMDKGQIVEEGTHDELLAGGGLYAGLYRLQFSERSE